MTHGLVLVEYHESLSVCQGQLNTCHEDQLKSCHCHAKYMYISAEIVSMSYKIHVYKCHFVTITIKNMRKTTDSPSF